MVMVTGATGHIGNVLVRKLAGMREILRVLVLPGEDLSSLKGIEAEIVYCDIRDRESVVEAFRGCDTVFHLAGIISIMGNNGSIMKEVNVLGTRNVVNACLRAKVKRLVYTSSIHAIREPEKGIRIVEDMNFVSGMLLGDYAKSKAEASQEILRGIGFGLDAVIVFPTGIIGPYDYKMSEMGRIIRAFAAHSNRRSRFYIKGAYDFVDVRDVVEGLILAWQYGKSGQGYILSGHRISIKDLFETLGEITGDKSIKVEVPQWIARAAAIMSPLYQKLTGRKPLVTRYSIDVLNSNSEVCRDKAEKELGFKARPIRDTLKDSVEWFLQNNKKALLQ